MRRAICAITGLAGLALLLFVAQASADDEPEIAVEAGASEIFIGESVDYLVEIRNAKNPASAGPVGAAQDFDVVANGDESRNQSSMFIINGRVSQQSSFSHVYRFRLTPKRTGKLVIPAPSATVDGKTISGRAAFAQRHRSRRTRSGHRRAENGSQASLSHAAVRGDAARAGAAVAGR